MEEVIKHINQAFEIIDSMMVSGRNQELCAAAKTELRFAYSTLEAINETTENKSDE